MCGGAWANTAFRILEPDGADRPPDSAGTPAPRASGPAAPSGPATPRNGSHVSSECQPQPQNRGGNSSSSSSSSSTGSAERLPSRCAELLGEQLAEEAWGREERGHEESVAAAAAPVGPSDRSRWRRQLDDQDPSSRAGSREGGEEKESRVGGGKGYGEGGKEKETRGVSESAPMPFTVRAKLVVE